MREALERVVRMALLGKDNIPDPSPRDEMAIDLVTALAVGTYSLPIATQKEIMERNRRDASSETN